MKKTILTKIICIMVVGLMTLFMVTPVFAATNESLDLDLTGGNNATNKANTNTNTNTNNAVNITLNTNTIKTNNTAVNNTNTLPKTGIADSIPMIVLVVIFAISGVYAYKKINDYKDI